MGVHWINPSEPVFNGQPFTETFIYGSYDGEVNFLETMIDKTYIEQFKSGSKPIKQPAKYPAPGKFYPTHYGFDYQPSAKILRLSMGTFVQK